MNATQEVAMRPDGRRRLVERMAAAALTNSYTRGETELR